MRLMPLLLEFMWISKLILTDKVVLCLLCKLNKGQIFVKEISSIIKLYLISF